jgi:hypothetical protein
MQSRSGILSPVISSPSQPPIPIAEVKPRRSPWGRRISLLIYVLVCIEVGMLLLVLPWSPVWENNALLLAHFELREFLQIGFVRGAISGLGLVNVFLGIWEAVHYSEKDLRA